MTHSTKPAFIHEGDWDAVTDSHPAMKWMREYTETFEQRKYDLLWDKYVASDFVYVRSTGETFPAGRASFDANVGVYARFPQYHFQPYFVNSWERDDGTGWEMIGNAWFFANLPGDDGAPKPHTDDKGSKWDIKVPGGFYFVYRKEGDGIKMASTAITSDSGPIIVEMLKRGIMKPADLGL